MDTWTYKSKAQALSNDSNNCVNLSYNSDPTQRYKAKLVALLRVEREIDHLPATVEKVVPDSRGCSNLLRGVAKIHKKDAPQTYRMRYPVLGLLGTKQPNTSPRWSVHAWEKRNTMLRIASILFKRSRHWRNTLTRNFSPLMSVPSSPASTQKILIGSSDSGWEETTAGRTEITLICIHGSPKSPVVAILNIWGILRKWPYPLRQPTGNLVSLLMIRLLRCRLPKLTASPDISTALILTSSLPGNKKRTENYLFLDNCVHVNEDGNTKTTA